MFLMKANKEHQNPIKDWCTHFLSLSPKVYFRIPKPWALQTVLQHLKSANVSDTYWADIRRGSMPVYTAPSYLASIGHESFTAGQWDLQCSRNPTRVWKRPHGVSKHLHEEWSRGARHEQPPATIMVCAHNLLGSAHTSYGFQNLKPIHSILYNVNLWQSAAECTSTQRWSAPNFTIFRILAKPQDYSVTGILRLESCMVDQIFTTHANDDPSTLNQILMD